MPSWHFPCNYQCLKISAYKNLLGQEHTFQLIITSLLFLPMAPATTFQEQILLTLWVSKWSACYTLCFVTVIIDSNERRNYAWNSIFGTLCLVLIINPLLECLWDPLHVLFKSPHRHIFCVITLQCVLVGNGTFNQRLSIQLQTQHSFK